MTRSQITRESVSLSVLDFGGRGPLALLLHGLAGHSGEWADTAAEMQEPDTWPQWEAVDCPTLVLCAGHGVIDPGAVTRMRATRPEASIVELADSRHDLHLDRPREWRQALSRFLATVRSSRSS